MKHESHALNRLRCSLGARATLLDCLDIAELRTEDQGEIPSAIPRAILFGHIKVKGPLHRRPLVWIYMCQKSLTLIFHSYQADGEAGGLLMLEDVLKKSAPTAAFDFATDPLRLVVLATYYFMGFDLKGTEDLTLTTRQEQVLLSICEDINKASGSNIITSFVVKLPITVPAGFLEERARMNKRKREALEQSDSGIDDKDSRRRISTASLPSPWSPINREQEFPDIGSTNHRYREDDDDQSRMQQLERKRRRMKELREDLEATQAELDREVEQVLALLEAEEQGPSAAVRSDTKSTVRHEARA